MANKPYISANRLDLTSGLVSVIGIDSSPVPDQMVASFTPHVRRCRGSIRSYTRTIRSPKFGIIRTAGLVGVIAIVLNPDTFQFDSTEYWNPHERRHIVTNGFLMNDLYGTTSGYTNSYPQAFFI
jgi:hypothetical protein